MFDLVELIWPRLTPLSEDEARLAKEHDREQLQKIRRQPWRRETDTALEEARRLSEAEAERRKTADTKAGTYLTVVGILTPILASFGPSLADAHASLVIRAISSLLLILAVSYLVRAGLWAFHALRVGVAYRVDSGELTSIWARPGPKAALVGQLLEATYRNRKPVNEKVSSIKMTDEFLVRAFMTFALLLAIQTSWKPAVDIWTNLHKSKPVSPAKVAEPPASVCMAKPPTQSKALATIKATSNKDVAECDATSAIDTNNVPEASYSEQSQ